MAVFIIIIFFAGILLPLARFLVYEVKGEDRFPLWLKFFGDFSAMIVLPLMYIFLLDGGITASTTFTYPYKLLLFGLITFCVLIYLYNENRSAGKSNLTVKLTVDVLLFLGLLLALLTGIHILDGAGLVVNLPISVLFFIAIQKNYRQSKNLLSSTIELQRYTNLEVIDDPKLFSVSDQGTSQESLSVLGVQLYSMHWGWYLLLLGCGAILVLFLVSLLGLFLGYPLTSLVLVFTQSSSGFLSLG